LNDIINKYKQLNDIINEYRSDIF